MMARMLLVLILFVGLSARSHNIPTIVSSDDHVDEVSIDPNNEFSGMRGKFVYERKGIRPSDPFQGSVSQAVGFYSDGSLINANALPMEGTGYLKIFQPRKREYSTYDMMKFIQVMSKVVIKEYPNSERLQIGDEANKNGGSIGSHASHQNGLDADIAYYRVNHSEYGAQSVDGFTESLVKNGKLSTNFDLARNWYLISTMVSTKRVNRIFVDEVIKAAFCKYAQNIGQYNQSIEVLRRLRPWPNHHNHLHLRLTCPDKSPQCQDQQEPPEGSGC